MGRKRKEKLGDFDRLGEAVNLEKCPECSEHTDCFSWMGGKCTALNVSGGQGCSFYKPAEECIRNCRAAYLKLKAAGRYDLIRKYIKAYEAMGFIDEDVEAAEQKASDFEAFRDSDYQEQMSLMSQASELL